MKYVNNETGEEESIEYIKQEYRDLLNNSVEFESYRDDFPQYLRDYYEEVKE